MISKQIWNKIIFRLDKWEEIIDSIKKLCSQYSITLWQINWLWATNQVKVWLYDTTKKQYFATEFKKDFEIAPLYGNISTMNDEIYLHCHINLSDENHQSFGWHLNYAYVSATFEWFIDIIDHKIDREFNTEVWLNVFKF